MARLFLSSLILSLAACSSAAPAADAALDAPRVDTGPLRDGAGDAGADAAPCVLVKPYSTKDPVCNQCAEQRCCPEINACLGDPACDDAYVNCMLACALAPVPDAGVDACLAQCDADHPTGKASYDVAIGCAESRCAVECQ